MQGADETREYTDGLSRVVFHGVDVSVGESSRVRSEEEEEAFNHCMHSVCSGTHLNTAALLHLHQLSMSCPPR